MSLNATLLLIRVSGVVMSRLQVGGRWVATGKGNSSAGISCGHSLDNRYAPLVVVGGEGMTRGKLCEVCDTSWGKVKLGKRIVIS